MTNESNEPTTKSLPENQPNATDALEQAGELDEAEVDAVAGGMLSNISVTKRGLFNGCNV